MKRILLVSAIVLAAGGALAHRLLAAPALARYADIAAPAAAADAPFTVTFLGVSTLLIRAGDRTIMTDGFFSRPGFLRTAVGKIEPDEHAIMQALERAGVGRLDAIFVAHSHYDHALDSAEVAKLTGALLVGSRSTFNLGLTAKLSKDRMRIVRGGDTLPFGEHLSVTVVTGSHSPGARYLGNIKEPLSLPAHASEYREGGSFAFIVRYAGRTVLVQSSAGYVPDAYDGMPADAVFLSIGTLGEQDDEFIDAYWDEVVKRTGATLVYPIHWDNFFRSLKKPMRPMPRVGDKFHRAMEFLLGRGEADGVTVWLPAPFVAIDPFAGN